MSQADIRDQKPEVRLDDLESPGVENLQLLKGKRVLVSAERELGHVIGYTDTDFPDNGQPRRTVKLYVKLDSGRAVDANCHNVYLVPVKDLEAVERLVAFWKKS